MTRSGDSTEIEELEALAAKVLELKKATRARRPIVLEFCGTPKSGKTSCLSSLNLFLKRNGFKTALLTERAGICPIGDKFNPLFNIWTSNSTIAELAEVLAERSKSVDVIICDRGIFDALCWFQWLRDHDHLGDADHESLVAYLTSDRLRSMIDLIYVLEASPVKAMEREYANLLTTKQGSIMNYKVLTEYNEAMSRATSEHGKKFRCVLKIDTSLLVQNAVSYAVTKDVLENLHGLVVEKIGYFKRKDLAEFEERRYWNFSEFDAPPRIYYGPRDQVEADDALVQPVPIVVITNTSRDEVLVVKKKKSSLGTSSPERDRLLVYMGGHIRQEDNLRGLDETLSSIASTALSREIQEELSLSLSVVDDDPLCIWVKDDARSQKHLALVSVYEADFDHLTLRLDDYEFVQKTGKSKSGRVFSVADLGTEEMEEWSRIIVAERLDATVSLGPLFDSIEER